MQAKYIGCRFKSRCPIATNACEVTDPQLVQIDASGHMAACINL
jgi:ABC-type dipeptide/oligopeptide/nickel transport system ATPase component